MYQGCTGFSGFGGVGYGGEYFIVHVDRIGCVFGFRPAFCDDDRYAVAHMQYLVSHEQWVRWFFHAVAVAEVDLPARGYPHDAVDVIPCKNRYHPRHSSRCGGVYASDAGMGVGAAQDIPVGHTGQHDIIGIVSFTGYKALVFYALDGFAYIGHTATVFECSCILFAAYWMERTILW